jgi:hypothetical protein
VGVVGDGTRHRPGQAVSGSAAGRTEKLMPSRQTWVSARIDTIEPGTVLLALAIWMVVGSPRPLVELSVSVFSGQQSARSCAAVLAEPVSFCSQPRSSTRPDHSR